MQILFLDTGIPFAYTIHTLKTHALRGTESTILRIAKSLSDNHNIYVAQSARTPADNQIIDNIHYISLETAYQLSPDVVILLKHQSLLESTAKHFPHARLYFWMHNLPARDFYKKHSHLVKYNYEIICVSHFHRRLIERRLRGKWYQRILTFKKSQPTIKIHVIYNPIEDDLQPDNTSYNDKQLIFTSSPYKGLPQTLKLFAALRKTFPEYHLLVISPDTQEQELSLPENVTLLKPLPYQQLISHIRESFCVFYPQTERQETFGLVYAEANAVGTPVLAHDFGAAREILSSHEQLIDGNSLDSIIKKITAWREKRPSVQGKSDFRLHRISEEWQKLLEK